MRFCLLLIGLTGILACNHPSPAPKFYGQSFDTASVITVSELVAQMQGQNKVEGVIKGQVTESCQDDGCWLNLENPGSTDVFVDWDHQFNLPTDISGKIIIAKGYAYYDTTKKEHPLAFKASGVHL